MARDKIRAWNVDFTSLIFAFIIELHVVLIIYIYTIPDIGCGIYTIILVEYME